MSGLSRRAFLATGAATATGAAIAAAPHIIGAHGASTDQTAGSEPAGVEVQPSGVAPREPIMAYVRDEQRGEVTVVAGLHETTYRDEALVKRLLAAAPVSARATEGGIDVIAP